MHPAVSVIVFTVLSGIGYGLVFWLSLLVAAGQAARSPALVLTALTISLVLVSAGLLASTLHLGRPERAWRAFSQWRSSWLSREGVVAVASYLPMLGLGAVTLVGGARAWQQGLALASAVLAVLTVFCTARIYTSLKPIAAWHNRWVLPGYLAMAAAAGGTWLWAIGVLGFTLPAHRGDVLILAVLLLLAGAVKLGYWRHIDRPAPRVDAASALGLPPGSTVQPFEAPHTQANFLLKEMGFALARKHGQRLRRLSLVLMVALPVAVLALAALSPALRTLAAALAPPAVLAGLLVERWLFFAQARHTVMVYYDTQPA